MVNPLEPGAGYPIQAHADHLAGLFEASFSLPEPVAAAVRAGLHRGYADCGWDLRAGQASPDLAAPPAVPSFAQLRQAIAAAATELHPFGQDTVRFDDIAPPLDFGIAGLPDWPGIRVRDRISGLRQHPMSMESQHNRQLAATALVGEDGSASLYADLATPGPGSVRSCGCGTPPG